MSVPARAEAPFYPLDGPADLVDLIGNTPLLDLSCLLDRSGVHLYAKGEHLNPGGSVKDRPARGMILAAEADGRLRPGKRILDATSGNTGIALAMIGAARGYGVTLCMAENASLERKRLLKAYGAEIVLTDPLAGSDGAILEARRLVSEEPGRYVYLDQYSNPENWRSHYLTTGPEIWRQTGGAITHFITGLGTSGTFCGTGRYLRERNPDIRLISAEPDGPMHGLEGMKHMETAIVPPIYDPDLADETTTISTEEAYDWVRRLGRDLGLALGVSAGGNVAVAHRLASSLEEGVVVTILCDGAVKYLSEDFWESP